MRVSRCVGCEDFPCADVRHESYTIPDVDARPDDISIVMISEAAPQNLVTTTMLKGDPCLSRPQSRRSTTPVSMFRPYGTYLI